MIGEYLDFVRAPHQERVLVSQQFDNGQQLEVVDVIVALCWCEGGGIESYWVPLVIVPVMTPPMVGSTWLRVRSTLESDCLPVLFQGTVSFCLVTD